MIYFHGGGRDKRYFEGWYFKHQSARATIAFIPGFHVTENGDRHAFVQVVTPDFSENFEFPGSMFSADKKALRIRVGDNIFSDKGINVDLKNDRCAVSGKLGYGEFTGIRSNVMGPFRFVPFMQCNHGVISLCHRLSGSLRIQDKVLDLNGGTGYIETDWGSSFPSKYMWIQASHDGIMPTCVMASVADIPFAGRNFMGCICCVLHQGKEYRLATYHGVKIERLQKTNVVLTQGKYRLEAEASPDASHKLRAPDKGRMDRQIHESVCCRVRIRFFESGRLLFDMESRNAGFEFVEGKIGYN